MGGPLRFEHHGLKADLGCPSLMRVVWHRAASARAAEELETLLVQPGEE